MTLDWDIIRIPEQELVPPKWVEQKPGRWDKIGKLLKYPCQITTLKPSTILSHATCWRCSYITLISWQYRFLFKFTGKDEEINLLGDGSEKAEFGEWSWMSPQQVVDRVGSPFFTAYIYIIHDSLRFTYP